MDATNPAALEHTDDTLKTAKITCEVLFAVATQSAPTISSIAEELGYAKSVVSDHLRTLTHCNFLVRLDSYNPISHDNPPTYPTYELSYLFLEAGDDLRRRFSPDGVIRTYLGTLAEQTNTLAHFAGAEYGDVVYLREERSENAIDLGLSPGKRDSITTTSFGKAILSTYRDELLSDSSMTFTPFEEDDDEEKAAFLDAMETIRDRGYAIDDEATRSMVRSVAAPVTVSGRSVGAIGVAGPPSQLTDAAVAERFGPAVVGAAESIEIVATYATATGEG
jgi:DNA-binding IclR family transcriptional regulator